MGIATQYEGGLKFDGDQMYITTSGGTTLLTLGNTGSANFVGAITTPNLFLGDSSVRLSPGTNGEVGINYNTSATGSLVWYAGGTASKFNVTNAGNATFAGTIGATNFSGSSSGTNTGDQTLPTLSSLGALSTTGKAADSHLLDGIDSSAFLRSNAADSFDGTLSWGGSAGSDAFDLNNSDIEDVRGIRAREFTQIASGVPRNNLGSPTVTEMALFDPQFRCMTDLSNNYNDLTDLTFYKQMTDSSEWEEVTYSDDQKRRFLRTNNSSVVIPNTAYKFRVEFNAPGYVFANAIYFYWSSQSHSTKVHIWKQRSDNDTWYQHTSADDNVSSWPGHLWMPFNTIPWHETASTTSHYHKVRVEFTPSWSTGTYSDRDIALSGGQIWGGYPSGRRTPHYYDQNGKLITWGDFEVNGKLNIDTRDTNTTSTTALVMNGNEVEQRTLGSNAFNSTSYITSQRAISSTPTDGATTTAISSDWAFDNVKTAVPANAVFTDTVNTFDGAYSSLSSIPSTFAPSAHSHGIGGITDASRWWNNFGDNHTTRTAFDAEDDSLTTGFGWRYVQGSTSGPGTSTSPNQFYALTVGLGNDYDYDNYAMQLVIPRNTSTPYISVRFEEGGSLGSWQKISAGYADSAGSIAYSNVTGTPTLGTAAAAATTDFATSAQGTTADAALPKAGGTMTGNVLLQDDVELRFGTDTDLKIYHDGANSRIANNTGHLYIQNLSDDKDILFRSDDGSGGTETYLNIDGSLGKVSVSKPFIVTNNATITGTLYTGDTITVGDGTEDSKIIIKNFNAVSEHIEFYNGSTRVGEIGVEDNTWLRINQETNKNIYTPRYIRADAGFFVDGTAKGINGSGNFIGGTITGASDANVSNWDTAYGWGDHDDAGYITSQRAISSTPTDGATTTSISSAWAFDNVKTAVPTNAVFTDTDTVYTHPTTAGNKHIPAGGAAGEFLRYSADGTAVWATPSYTTNTNTTYSAGAGLDLTGTTFSIEPDLRDGITLIGKNGSNYIAIDHDDNNCIDFYISGVWIARMEADGDLHMKGDVIAFSDIFNP